MGKAGQIRVTETHPHFFPSCLSLLLLPCFCLACSLSLSVSLPEHPLCSFSSYLLYLPFPPLPFLPFFLLPVFQSLISTHLAFYPYIHTSIFLPSHSFIQLSIHPPSHPFIFHLLSIYPSSFLLSICPSFLFFHPSVHLPSFFPLSCPSMYYSSS